MSEALSTSDPQPQRVDLPGGAYELIADRAGIVLRIEETGHDAAIALAHADVVELRARLAAMLVPHDMPTGGVMSEAGHAILLALRGSFAALIELDKKRPLEVDELLGYLVSSLRSWRPQALMVMPKAEVAQMNPSERPKCQPHSFIRKDDSKECMHTCFSCGFWGERVECYGIYCCPNPMCGGCGASWIARDLKSVVDLGSSFSVDEDELRAAQVEHVKSIIDEALLAFLRMKYPDVVAEAGRSA
jgi:hypothetical protein